MLIVLSPSKKLNFSPPPPVLSPTARRLQADTAELAEVTRRLTRADLRQLMSISDNLADLNHDRFQAFDADCAESGVPAAFAFSGDVYETLSARTLDADALTFAQDHIRLLSGLYGLLRPLDCIQPYRLEMGVRLKTARGSNLYDFWGDRIAQLLNADAEGHVDKTLVNLASQEYFGAVDAKALKLPLITPHFREEKDGELRLISFFAKKARGSMARYAIDLRLERVEDLKGFNRDGYRFAPDHSTDTDWVFTRLAQA